MPNRRCESDASFPQLKAMARIITVTFGLTARHNLVPAQRQQQESFPSFEADTAHGASQRFPLCAPAKAPVRSYSLASTGLRSEGERYSSAPLGISPRIPRQRFNELESMAVLAMFGVVVMCVIYTLWKWI